MEALPTEVLSSRKKCLSDFKAIQETGSLRNVEINDPRLRAIMWNKARQVEQILAKPENADTRFRANQHRILYHVYNILTELG